MKYLIIALILIPALASAQVRCTTYPNGQTICVPAGGQEGGFYGSR